MAASANKTRSRGANLRPLVGRRGASTLERDLADEDGSAGHEDASADHEVRIRRFEASPSLLAIRPGRC